MVGVVPQAGLGGLLLQLGTPLEEVTVDAEEPLRLGQPLGQRLQRGRDVGPFGLAAPPSGALRRGHLSWRRGRA
jgi:hypothetical protein